MNKQRNNISGFLRQGFLWVCTLAGTAIVALAISGCSQEEPASESQESRPEKSVREYAKEIEDPEESVRREAFRALAQIGPEAEEAVPALVEALNSKDPKVRRTAAQVLGEIGKPAVEPLAKTLSDSIDPVEMKWVAEALGEIGEKAEPAVPVLLQTLNDIYPDVRASAVLALGKIRETTKAPSGFNREIRIKDQTAADVAKMVFGEESSGEVSNFNTSVKREQEKGEMRGALNYVGYDADDIMEPLPDEENPELVIEFGWNKNRKGGPPVVPALVKLLQQDEKATVRAASAQALGFIGPGGEAMAVRPLIAALYDRHLDVQISAAWALGRIGSGAKEAIPVLEQLSTNTQNRKLRDYTREAKRKIQRE